MLDSDKISKNIKRIRKDQMNKTQEEFAELIKSSKDTVSNIERGKVIPNTHTLANIAKYCNCSIDSILGLKD